MSTPSRESFDASKHYRRSVFINDRYVPDFSLNEMQALQDAAREDLGDSLYYSSAIVDPFTISLPGSGQIVLSDGRIWAFGRVEEVPGATLAYDPAKVTGVDVVYARWLLDHVTISEDATLVHPPTGEAIDERERVRTTLVTSTPDLFDETFERWDGDIPLSWTRPSGSSAKGYPAKFGRTSLELRHTNGIETRLEREIVLTPSATHQVYLQVRTQEGYTDLSLSHGAYLDFERASPSWTSTDFTFATTKQWLRKAFTVVADGNSEAVKIRLVIPSTAPSTRILVDALLVSTEALGASDLDRHYLPLLSWDRATDIVTKIIPRSSRLPMKELVPPLPGEDIADIGSNAGLQKFSAIRTFHENGHWKIPPGLRVRRDTSRDDSTHLGLKAFPGWAYVLGFQCQVASTQELLTRKATDVATVSGENDAFAFGTNLYGLNKAEGIDQFPINQITQLQITYEQVVSVTKGADGSVDDTGVQNVSSVQGVSAGTAGALTGTATSFTFTEAAKTFTASVSPYAGGAVGSAQSIVFARGSFTVAQVLEALNSGSGPAYRSGKIVGNVVFENDGSGHVRVRTKTLSNASTVTLGSGDANAVLGLTDSATNTGTGTHYVETTSWVRSGNSVDWVAGQAQPSQGASYSVVVRNTETLVLNTDYRLGGAFVAEDTYYYKITSVVSGTESQPGSSVSIVTPIGSINLVNWSAVGSAQSYGVYRSEDDVTFELLKFVDGSVTSFRDDGTLTPNAAVNPPGSGGTAPTTTTVVADSTGVINLNPVGKMPVDTTNLSVDYEYYQPYMAYVVINRYGTIYVAEGESADRPEPPTLHPHVMELAQIEVKANSGTILIRDIKKYDRVPMQDLRILVDRVGELELNDLRQQVLNDIQKRGDGATHKARIAEGFADESGSDFSYDSGGVTSAVGLHPALSMAGIPSTYTQPTLAVNTGNTDAVKVGEEYILPSTEYTLIDQPLISESLSINPYLGVRIPSAIVRLFPNAMSWALTLPNSLTPQQQNARKHTLFAALWRKTVNRWLPPWNTDAEIIQQTAQQQVRKGLETTYPFETEAVTVVAEGQGFLASEANITGTFGGIAVDLTAVSPTTQGTPSGGKTTVNADTMGRWKATFVVPAGVSAGTNDFVATGPTRTGRATFTSLAYGEIVPEPPLVEATLYDPLAQSIGPWPQDRTISAVEVYFVSPAANMVVPIYLQIRTMDGGFPTRIALASKAISPAEVTWNTGTNPATWTATKITLDRPVYIPANTQVAVTWISGSPSHKLATATRTQKDQNGKRIVNNPYGAGVLFASSNGITWEGLQETDLAMKVYGRSYSASAVLEFNSVSPSNVSRLWLAADQFVPEGTTLKWEYVLNGGAARPIAPFTKLRPPAIPSTIVLRARLARGANFFASPRVMLPTMALVGQQRGTAGKWISPAITFSQTISNALLSVYAHIPAGAAITWYISRDDGAAWTAMSTPTDITDIDAYFKRYDWNTPVSLGGSSTVKKVRIRADFTIGSHLNYGPVFSLVGAPLT